MNVPAAAVRCPTYVGSCVAWVGTLVFPFCGVWVYWHTAALQASEQKLSRRSIDN
jgi:hypothetical protein